VRARKAGFGAAVGAIVAAVGVLSWFAAPPVASAPTTSTFDFTTNNNGVQTYTVDPGVCAVDVDVRGAQGGNGTSSSGGLGGRAEFTALPVTPGEVLEVRVGGQGGGIGGSGGLNGGGNGSNGGTSSAAAGGGASDIRRAPYGIGDRLVIGGGGGGATNIPGINGGAGGGLSGANGDNTLGAGAGGGGADQVNPGAAGVGDVTGQAGDAVTLGTGGNGASGAVFSGGGGGGGLHGGGGASAWSGGQSGGGGGGGGGSGFTPDATGLTAGFQTGDGQVLITADPAAGTCPTTTVPATPASSTVARFTG